MAKKDQGFLNLIGGLDTRLNDEAQKENVEFTFWSDASNVEVDGSVVKTMLGNVDILAVDYSGMLNLFNYKPGDYDLLVGMNTSGEVFSVDVTTGGILALTSGFNNVKPHLSQYGDDLVIINGVNDPVIYSYLTTTVTPSTLYAEKSVYGYCGCAFKGRLFIADGSTLYYCALGDPTDWTTANDAGYIQNFFNDRSDIKGLENYGEYMVIHKVGRSYLLKGNEPGNFEITPYVSKGSSSRFGICNLFNEQFFFSDGIFSLGQFGDLGQVTASAEYSIRIHSLFSDIDLTKLDEIVIVPYSNKNQMLIYVPIVGVSGLSKCFVMDFNRAELPRFWKRDQQVITGACGYKGDVYTCTSNGKILKEFYGNTLDGAILNSYFYSCWISFKEFAKTKLCNFITVLTNYLNIEEVDMIIKYDKKDSYSDDYTLRGYAGNAVYDTAIYDTSRFSSENDFYYIRKPIRRRWNSIKVGFKNNETIDNQTFGIEGFTLNNIGLTQR
jgi:hypothetical protein